MEAMTQAAIGIVLIVLLAGLSAMLFRKPPVYRRDETGNDVDSPTSTG